MRSRLQTSWPHSARRWFQQLRTSRARLVGGLCALAVATALLGAFGVHAQEADLEYKLKAAFLFNFLKLTQWPASKFVPTEPSMVVACFADDLAAPNLARALDGKTVSGLPIRFVTFQDNDDPRNCHVFFLSRSHRSQMDETLNRLKKAPVLTVSELDQFAQHGGMINFIRHEKAFRFEINLEAAERVHLRISSDLSSMATIIKNQPPK